MLKPTTIGGFRSVHCALWRFSRSFCTTPRPRSRAIFIVGPYSK